MLAFWKTRLIVVLALASLLVIAASAGVGLLVAQGVAQSQEPSGTASVSGELLDATTSVPVKGKVFLSRLESSFVRAVSTDEHGAYQLAGLAPGVYKIDGNADGYLSEPVFANLVVRPGHQLHGLNLRLALPGSVSGSVHDPAGLPLARVSVQLVTQEEHPRAAGTVNTDENGAFHISRIWPGNYYVRAIPTSARTDAEGMALDADPVYFPQAQRIADAQSVKIAAGKETSAIDLTMKPLPTYSVTGRIIDGSTGKPVSQGALAARHNDRRQRFSASSQIAPDGSFRLQGMPAGHYEMVFSMAPGAKASRLPEFDLGDEDTSGVVFTVKPGIALRGHVVTNQPLPQGFYVSLAARGRVELPELGVS